VRRALPNLRACAVVAAAVLAFAGCGGGGERRDAGATTGTYTVAVKRATFPSEQHLAQRSALVIAVRNAGRQTIPDLNIVVRGFTDRMGGARNADPTRDLWIVDRGPAGAATAFADTWAAGRLAPGDTATLRWDVTPVVAGTHELTYEIAPALAGSARAQLVGGREPQGTLAVRVLDKPASARVDPRTGGVQRQE
jgi:hypothetical protein